ncbi:alpha/beta hydrolase [Streptomyces sp. NBC_01498]|uniref:alpha/beta fold hydrolase n=1 Tax=Streptomyces sp. NBC_01498 TaxID=2975870 RepID=UPI002E7B1E11|nr:alpha/beta hydrolase [Streptomyces sp. NBC_01498]WTL25336.1 alpha/beta hydrolase [Streptomyces sp. NBC_01498]
MSSTETEKRIKVNGTELLVRDTGEENLPVVLALHSLFLDGRMFEGFKDAAAGSYRVIRPDFRGQGGSAAAEGDFIHLDTVTADVIALAEALGLEQVHLLAQSMGGDVGFRVAAARPGLIRSMVALGSSACSEPAGQLVVFREWVDKVGRQGFVGDVLQETMEIMFGATTRDDPAKRDIVALWESRIAEVPRTLRPAMAGVIERGTAVHLLPRISAPVFIVSGEEDKPRPVPWQDEMAEHLPNATLWRLEKIGHSPILEAPDVVLPRVLDFYDQVEKS